MDRMVLKEYDPRREGPWDFPYKGEDMRIMAVKMPHPVDHCLLPGHSLGACMVDLRQVPDALIPPEWKEKIDKPHDFNTTLNRAPGATEGEKAAVKLYDWILSHYSLHFLQRTFKPPVPMLFHQDFCSNDYNYVGALFLNEPKQKQR